MGRPRQNVCGNGLHDFRDPANYYVVYDRQRGQYRRKCRPCALARKRIQAAKEAQERATRPYVRPWWEQLEWTGPHRAGTAWTRARWRRRSAQGYKLKGHPLAYRPTTQQLTFLQALADGMSTEEIAERECCTPNTIRNAMIELRRKYGVTSNAAAVAQGLKRCAIRPDTATAKRLPYRLPAAAVRDVRALVLGERLPHKASGRRIWKTLDPLMCWSEAHAVSVLWAAGKITSRHVPQTRNRYRRRRITKRAEDTAIWKANADL